MSAPEFALQKAICQTLDAAYPAVLYWAVPNGAALCAARDDEGRKRAQREMSKLKVTGLRPGVPDLALYWPGGHALVEIKSATGRIMPGQIAVHLRLKDLGVRVAVWRSLEDMREDLAEWGVPNRIARAA